SYWPPSGWSDMATGTSEEVYEVFTGPDGQVLELVSHHSTGFLESVSYSPMDLLTIGRVLLAVGRKVGSIPVRSWLRKKTANLEARTVLSGPTKDLAKQAEAKLAKSGVAAGGVPARLMGGPGAKPTRLYKGTKKHGPGGWGSREPTNGQRMLDLSFGVDDVKEKALKRAKEEAKKRGAADADSRLFDTHRIAYDFKNKEIVVFRRESMGQGSSPDIWHGYVVPWDTLHSDEKAVLIKEEIFKPTGKEGREAPFFY